MDLEERAGVEQRVDQLAHVERLVLVGRDQLADRAIAGRRRGGRRRARRLAHERRREVAQVAPRELDPLLVARHERVADAAAGGVHPRAAHLLERDLLADHHLGHARRPEVHRRVAVAHDHDVAERRDVGAAGGARAEQHAHLRDDARQPHLVEEDPPGVPAAREHLHLLVDPRAGRVDQVHERDPQGQRPLLDPQDLLDGLGRPRPGLDRRVVGHHRHRAAGDRPDARSRRPRRRARPASQLGEQPLLGERARIEQQRDPLAHGQLALLSAFSRWRSGPPASARARRDLQRHRRARRRSRRHHDLPTPPGRPSSTWLPSGRPSTSCAAREAVEQRAAGPPRSRSPSRASIETRSSVAMLPVAPAGTGQPPSSPKLDSKLSTPGLERRQHVREPLTARVVEVRGQLDARQRARTPPRRTSRTCTGLAIPVVSPNPTSTAPASTSARAIVEHPLDRHVPLVRAPERGRDHALAAQPLGQRPRERALASPPSDSVDRAADVLLVVGLRRRQEAVDLLEPIARRAARARARARSGSAR